MKITAKEPQMHMQEGTYYIWVGGSCDYAHEERASGAAYIMQKDGKAVDTFVTADDHTTEFRMILVAMIHAMQSIPDGSHIVFLTNVSYIQQNYDKAPTDHSANADLITQCIQQKGRHRSVTVKVVPFHKYHLLPETHALAHEAMMTHRRKKK